MTARCTNRYGNTESVCELPAGHPGDHQCDTGDGDGWWTWATSPFVHHPSCPQRHHPQAYCLCGPEAAAEDRVILASRTPATMLLDVLAHADLATLDQPLLCGPVGRRLARALGVR